MKAKKTIVFAIICLLAVSSIALTIQVVSAQRPSTENVANRLTQANWAKMNGQIQELNEESVRGQLQTQIRTAVRESDETKEVVSATAIWTTNLDKDIQPDQATEDRTYTYYVARLPADSAPTLDLTDGTYTISGTWNLAIVTVTITVTKDDQGNVINVHKEQDITSSTETGTLTITTADSKLELKIGDDTLSGQIYRSVTRSWFNPYKMADDNSGSTVTRTDVKTIAKSYGASPGWGNFNLDMDFNRNYRVDIADISTVAANT